MAYIVSYGLYSYAWIVDPGNGGYLLVSHVIVDPLTGVTPTGAMWPAPWLVNCHVTYPAAMHGGCVIVASVPSFTFMAYIFLADIATADIVMAYMVVI